MARLKNGILGGITGKIGNIEGYMLNGEYIIRSRRRKSTKPPTEKQVASRQRIKAANHFLHPILEFAKVGFEYIALTRKSRACNIATSYLVKDAIEGETIDYSKVRLSEGPINTQDINASVVKEVDNLIFTWTPDLSYAHGNDHVMLLAYTPELNEAVYTLCGAKRSAGIDTLKLPDDSWKGKTIEIYLSFKAENSILCGNSLYLGQII
ncbi:hypothetical protein SAMN05518672_102542 [Chitinophaga sp. CF118]|uniref:DUF6266 family protein n=1 Tax=Chitinophaga sp. CF118 TaxID=1884367 RepID=UPI0008E3B50B|nr:DUF6266 family protein [Chitinophaga sp. CF118]SFD59579.1 hypothetical protein SAMN05518672_102542 [Chitinophaga sp. CF118]